MTFTTWNLLDARYPIDALGFLPEMLNTDDPRPAAQQLDSAYQHGGGWRPFKGFSLNLSDMSITYPGDPAYKPIAETYLRDERILLYPHAWVLILQKDESFEVCRMD